jgi:hypothetical protein
MARLAPILDRGGLDLQGQPEETVSGRSGRAPIERIGGLLTEAVEGAEVVLVDCHPPEFEQRMPALLPHLAPARSSTSTATAIGRSSVFAGPSRRRGRRTSS